MTKLEPFLETSTFLKSSYQTVHSTNFKVLFCTRELISLFILFERPLLQVDKIDCFMDILIAIGCHSCNDQTEVTGINMGTFSLRTLLKTFAIMQNGEKA